MYKLWFLVTQTNPNLISFCLFSTLTSYRKTSTSNLNVKTTVFFNPYFYAFVKNLRIYLEDSLVLLFFLSNFEDSFFYHLKNFIAKFIFWCHFPRLLTFNLHDFHPQSRHFAEISPEFIVHVCESAIKQSSSKNTCEFETLN